MKPVEGDPSGPPVSGFSPGGEPADPGQRSSPAFVWGQWRGSVLDINAAQFVCLVPESSGTSGWSWSVLWLWSGPSVEQVITSEHDSPGRDKHILCSSGSLWFSQNRTCTETSRFLLTGGNIKVLERSSQSPDLVLIENLRWRLGRKTRRKVYFTVMFIMTFPFIIAKDINDFWHIIIKKKNTI